jgi:hypothetical protein
MEPIKLHFSATEVTLALLHCDRTQNLLKSLTGVGNSSAAKITTFSDASIELVIDEPVNK